MKLTGTIIAIATPMDIEGNIDYPTFEKLIDWQIQEGCDGLVIAGATGEAATLSCDEKIEMFRFAHRVIAGRVPVIAGTGTNCTRSSIALSKAAYDLGVTHTLLTCPYYNKPTQEGLFLHYQAIAEATPKMQHILYSIPGRCVIRIENETVIRLSKIGNIVGLKDSSSSAERIRLLRAACGPDFSLLASDDEFTLKLIESGGDGVISVAANVVPHQMREMVSAALAGNFAQAKKLDEALAVLYKNLFVQTNPIPVKALLHHMGKIQKGIRLPLTWLEEQYQEALWTAYAEQ